jgi:hypothetical protein
VSGDGVSMVIGDDDNWGRRQLGTTTGDLILTTVLAAVSAFFS